MLQLVTDCYQDQEEVVTNCYEDETMCVDERGDARDGSREEKPLWMKMVPPPGPLWLYGASGMRTKNSRCFHGSRTQFLPVGCTVKN